MPYRLRDKNKVLEINLEHDADQEHLCAWVFNSIELGLPWDAVKIGERREGLKTIRRYTNASNLEWYDAVPVREG